MRVSVQVERHWWAEPGESIFDIRAEFQHSVLIHLADLVGKRVFYGQSPMAETEPVTPQGSGKVRIWRSARKVHRRRSRGEGTYGDADCDEGVLHHAQRYEGVLHRIAAVIDFRRTLLPVIVHNDTLGVTRASFTACPVAPQAT